MIQKISLFIILAMLLPDIYIYVRYLRRRHGVRRWHLALWWCPFVVMTAYTAGLSMIRDFMPYNVVWLNVYLYLLGLIMVPKIIFVICSLSGRLFRQLFRVRRNWGNYVGVVLAMSALYVLVYGSTVGVNKLTVRHVDLYYANLPAAFDGYRIVQFSDLHVGSLDAAFLERVINTVNASDGDIIAFTGDLQNMYPSELNDYCLLLGSLHAPDGVFSVLGNHDYSMYIKADTLEKEANEKILISRQKSYGWQLLRNEHRIIRRGQDSIVIAGEENGGRPPFPQKSDIRKTLSGVAPSSFVVLMQHDPSAWRRYILACPNIMLTLSGHTHGGQVSLFGQRPLHFMGKEDYGVYREGRRVLNVSSGIGGTVPFRYGVYPEIVIITLHKHK